ncbi:endonuclease SmrB [Psychrobium sp. 1_MG-2023]|uniref:endonuclease SmrB n=1 Tax=Psychrobium sp. 1_MG-2023 TaxID=3062624 RepID=UPI002735A250|nr:endonuclease SmrB [Psychrobium sp. 1_MG-2023]MDP2560184.1 endonuclease SmrB [Psychrobium sp. 1_MG-2023]
MSDLLGCDNIKPMVQDKVQLTKPKTVLRRQRVQSQQKQAEFYFSDGFIPNLPDEGPMRYCRDDVEKYELKKLRRGDYFPELVLDLHGLTQNEAKQEILAMFKECKKTQIQCCCIVHGVSGGTLKTRTPYWISQYPELLAFHQAPLEWGGQGALLVLLDNEPDENAKID